MTYFSSVVKIAFRPARVFLSLGLCAALLLPDFVNPRSAYAAGVSAVWANDGGDKVTQDELRATSNGSAVYNSVWDGTTIKIFGGRNEVVNFNLILEAVGGASSVGVTFNTLTGPNGSQIKSSAASGDGVFSYVGRNIELFYVRYLQIKGLSQVSYGWYDERHIPQKLQRPWSGEGLGSGTWTNRPNHDKFYPEITVPLELVPTFNIAGSQNQSVWCDIFIPKTATPGTYTGTVSIKEGGVVTRQVPVQLTVRNFTLPDTPNSKTMLFFSNSNINHRLLGSASIDPNSASGITARQIRDRYFMMAHRHKISLLGEGDCSNPGDQPCAETLPRLNGSLFTSANGYDGPGIGVGNNVYSIGTYGSWGWQSGGQTAMNQHTDAWANWFAQNSPSTEYFLYLIDESANTAQIQTWANWIATNPGPGRQVKSMATIRLPTAASSCPALDIPTSTLTEGISTQWQPQADVYTVDSRKRFFMYNGSRPATGSFATEDDGVALRELAWAQYKKHINRWFFWESTYYNNYQGGTGETNLFRTAQTFGGTPVADSVAGQKGWNYSNGDGVMAYPGTDQLYPADSYGVKGLFAGIRMKEWRRGIQDADYLTMATATNPPAVQALVNTMVPKALWDYGVSDVNDPTWVRTNISWNINPDVWEAARKQLADILDPSGASAAPSSNTNVTLQKSVSPTVAKPGDTVIFMIQYQNTGSAPAKSTVLTDVVPTGTTLIAGSITGGGTLSGNTITWNLGNLNNNSSGSVSFQAKVN
jgi:uncharacterized repeat protein (TIGR01451 family)